MSKRKKTLIIIICIILCLLILLVSSYFLLRYFGKKRLHTGDKNIDTDAVEIEDDVVSYNGKKYKLDPDVVSFLVMGIDKDDITVNSGVGKNGQADCIFVLAVDTADKTYKVIPISRETMVDVSHYSTSGIYNGVKREQLCLAYAYGSTPEECSKNVMTSVSRVLYGINISHYVAIDMNGLAKFTKTIGGVKVNALETINFGKLKCTKDQSINLMGEYAILYIRDRDDDIDANNRRMQRQKQFLSALVSKTGNLISDDFTRLATYYNQMSPYTSTNVGLPELTYLASTCLTRDLGNSLEYKVIDGTMTSGEHAEFNIDENSLLPIIFDVFYDEIK